MNGLDLFSGIGGITQALAPWVTPIAYCEVDPHAQRLLLRRMACGELPSAPIWDDVRTLGRSTIPAEISVDCIYGGFPCQDISTAGLGAGLAGKRSGLFHEICRLAREFSPTFIFLENVPAIRTRGLDVVLQELALMGFDARWTTVSADFVGAPHRRERWFLLATHPDRVRVWDRWERLQAGETEAGSESGNHGPSSDVANANAHRCHGQTVPASTGIEEEGAHTSGSGSAVSDSVSIGTQVQADRGLAAVELSGSDGENRETENWGGGLYPTPCARDWKDNGSPAEYRRKSPQLTAVVLMSARYPTPTCTDSSNTPRPPRKKTLPGTGKITGGQKPGLLESLGSALNPRWVEGLMGYPVGWTQAGPWEPTTRGKKGSNAPATPIPDESKK